MNTVRNELQISKKLKKYIKSYRHKIVEQNRSDMGCIEKEKQGSDTVEVCPVRNGDGAK